MPQGILIPSQLNLADSIHNIFKLNIPTSVANSQSTVANSVATTTLSNTSLNVSSPTISAATTANVGDYITDISFSSFIAPQSINFTANGMKPGSNIYAYFSNIPVNAFVAPATSNGTVWTPTGTVGSPLIVNSAGSLSGIFYVPANTFYVGSNVLFLMDVNNILSIDAATTQSSATFNAYNFTATTTTRPGDSDTNNSIGTGGSTPSGPTLPSPNSTYIATPSLNPTFTPAFANIAGMETPNNTFAYVVTGNSVTVSNVSQPIQLGFSFTTANVYNNAQNRYAIVEVQWTNPANVVQAAYCFTTSPSSQRSNYYTDAAWGVGGNYNLANGTIANQNVLIDVANGSVITFSVLTAGLGASVSNTGNVYGGIKSGNNIAKVQLTVNILNITQGSNNVASFSANVIAQSNTYTGT